MRVIRLILERLSLSAIAWMIAPAAGCVDASRAVDVVVEHPWSAHEAIVHLTFRIPTPAVLACTLEGDPDEVHLAEGSLPMTSHRLRLAGLLAGATYHCEGAATFALRTPVGDPGLPLVHAATLDPGAGREYILTNHTGPQSPLGTQRLLVFDRQGQVRWHAVVPARGSALEFRYLGDDAFSWGGGWKPDPAGRPRQISLYGGEEQYDSALALPDPENGRFHHDGKQLSDGRWLTLEETDVLGPEGPFLGFGVRRIDPVANVVDFTYDSQRAVDEGHLPIGLEDAWHANWADVVEVDGREVLFVSLCLLSWTVAIDVETGDWLWTFGRGGDFALMEDVAEPAAQIGFPECQHGLQTDGSRLLVYDNGWIRRHSRAVQYQLDPASMTATPRWSWTEEDWYERSFGSVDWLPSGNVLIGMGHREGGPRPSGDHTTFVELDPTIHTKLWEATFDDVHDRSYRADWADPCALFANAKVCPRIRQRLDALGL